MNQLNFQYALLGGCVYTPELFKTIGDDPVRPTRLSKSTRQLSSRICKSVSRLLLKFSMQQLVPMIIPRWFILDTLGIDTRGINTRGINSTGNFGLPIK